MGIRSTPLPISVNKLGQVDIPQDRLDVEKQLVQLRMSLVANFFDFFKLLFFLLCHCYICHSADMEAVHCLWLLLTASGNLF